MRCSGGDGWQPSAAVTVRQEVGTDFSLALAVPSPADCAMG